MIAIAKEQLSPFFTGVGVNNQGKITTTTRKCCREVKTEPYIKTGFNFTSQRFSYKWKVIKKDFNVRNRKRRIKSFLT